jgi:iron complex outermembrane receptor protein
MVTAMKRSQSIQDTPVSISAISSEILEDRGIRDMHDIKFATPSLQYGSVLGSHNITIRGIGSFNGQPGIPVSVDGVYQTKDTASQMYQLDLKRIEIARGPQGTLYGRNSNGGAVNMITAAPTREHEGYVRVGFAEFDELTTQAVYSGPISDRVAIRVALDHKDTGDGWINNLVPDSGNLMEGENTNARVKLAMDLSEQLTADFSYSVGESGGAMDQYEWITDNRELSEPLNPGISRGGYIVDAISNLCRFSCRF